MALGPISTNFTEGDWSLWDFHSCTQSAPIPYYGCGGGPSNTCNRGSGGNFGDLTHQITNSVSIPAIDSPGWKQLLVQMQFGIFAESGFNFDPLDYIVNITDGVSGGDSQWMFYSKFNIRSNGSMELIFTVANPPGPERQKEVSYLTAAGIFPLDGSIHAVQILWYNLSPASVSYKLVLDNIVVLSGTHAPLGYPSDSYGYYPFGELNPYRLEAGIYNLVVRHFRTNTSSANRFMTNCAQFIATNAGSIVSYSPCSAAKIQATTCFTSGPPDDHTPQPDSDLPIPSTMDVSGIYLVTFESGSEIIGGHDNYYDRNTPPTAEGKIERKIPNPTIRTALMGD